MRHRVDGRHFGRTANQRKALLRGFWHLLLNMKELKQLLLRQRL